MNTLEILEIFKNNNRFLGVFPRNKMPQIKMTPCCFIANTDVAPGKGEHWIAFYVVNLNKLEFIDSLGNFPETYQFHNFTDSFREVIILGRRLQNIGSQVCGLYSCYFLIKRLKNENLIDIYSTFTLNKTKNDKVVCKFMKNIYHTEKICK